MVGERLAAVDGEVEPDRRRRGRRDRLGRVEREVGVPAVQLRRLERAIGPPRREHQDRPATAGRLEPRRVQLGQADLRARLGAGEVEAHARAVEPVDRDLVDRRAVGDEVGRRIDMRGRVQAQRHHGVAEPVAFEQVQRRERRLGVSGDRNGLGGQRHRQIHEHRRSSPGRDATVLWPLPAVRLEETG